MAEVGETTEGLTVETPAEGTVTEEHPEGATGEGEGEGEGEGTPAAEGEGGEGEGEAAATAPQPGDIEYTKKVKQKIDKITWEKNEALRRAAYAEGKLAGTQTPPAPEVTEPVTTGAEPQEADFETNADFVKALSSHQYKKDKAADDARTRSDVAASARSEMDTSFQEKATASNIREKHPDFDEAIRTGGVYTPVTEELVKTSENGPAIAYHFSQNPEESQRIARMSPVQAAREIARLDLSFGQKPIKKTVSSAGAPIKPVGGSGSGGPLNKSPDEMSQKEYEAARLAGKL